MWSRLVRRLSGGVKREQRRSSLLALQTPSMDVLTRRKTGYPISGSWVAVLHRRRANSFNAEIGVKSKDCNTLN